MNILFDYQKSYIIDTSGARQQSPIYLSYQSKPTWIINFKTVENTVSAIDLSDAVTWSSAVDKDFNSTTEPMVRTLNTDIDSSDAINGNISIILDTDTTTFQNAIGTNRTINAYFELRGFNASGDEIYYCQFKIIALNKLDVGTGDPLDPVENYYTIAQVDGLLIGVNSDITDNTNNIAINTTAISNTYTISQVDLNFSTINNAISNNTDDIATNSSDIATNRTLISINAGMSNINNDLINTNINNISNNTTAITSKENSLNNPSTDDYILSSKVDGTRSWVAMAGSGGAVDSVNGAIGVVVLNQDNITDGVNFVQYSTTEKSKLANTPSVFAPTDAQKNSDITISEIENKLIGEISTHSHDLSSLVIKTNVLELDNTTSFTPTADYNPATKKYVDDNSSSGGSSIEVNIETISADKTLLSTDKTIQILDGGTTDRNIDMYDATANIYHNFTNAGTTNDLIIRTNSIDTDVIIVSGAGTNINDTYTKKIGVTFNGGEVYTISTGLLAIFYNGSSWSISDWDDTNNWDAGPPFYDNVSTLMTAPLTGWTTATGVAPVPSLTYGGSLTTYATLKPTESVKIASELDTWAVAEQINRGSKIYDNGSQSGSVSLDFSNGDYQQLSTVASDPILGIWINNSISGDKLEIEFDNTNATTVNINSIRMIETIDTGKYIITMRNILGIIRVDKTKIEIK